MRLGGRVEAAIEVLTDIENQHTPATDALRDWGKAHRFAGSKDRSFIGNIVHDALREKSSIAWRMGDDSARAAALGTVVYNWGITTDELIEAFAEDKHAPKPLTEIETKALNGGQDLALAPDWVRADIPEWIWPSFSGNFDDEAIAEGRAIATRPPLDMRANSLKSTREEALEKLAEFEVGPSPISPLGIRINPKSAAGRLPNIQPEAIFQTGGIEIQDEGSQIAALLVNAKPGETILDYCAGGGGKTLALAAQMNNEGQLYAFDVDKRRLAPIYQRMLRAGATNIEVVEPPAGNLKRLYGKMDKVLIDAPCTGAGTWRRRPDAKWRLSPDTLELRTNEQAKVLEQAQMFVKDGGYMVYVTCSMLAEENEAQVYGFLEEHPEFQIVSAGEVWEDAFGTDAPKPWSADGCTLTMTPAATGTDGFFFAVMEKVVDFDPGYQPQDG
ncbi:MAG: RsmB/NOP family class I SAM-dependent RNA methyltransferase [Robiginitomaculum sp.]